MNSEALYTGVADLMFGSHKVVVFSGAGISTESGIPDFRSPGGIWEKYDPADFTFSQFISSQQSRKQHWQILREGGLTAQANPNPAHKAIAEMDRLGKLDCVITQNVDNLHQRGGVPDDKVLELHGNMQWAICLQCGMRYTFQQVLTRLEEGEEAPDCPACHGILKPDVVMFGESLSQKTLDEAFSHSANCDLFIVIGSSLVVYPAALMPLYAVEAGANLVIINLTATPLDERASIVIRNKAGEVMPQIVELVRQKLI